MVVIDSPADIHSPSGKLGVLMPGLGAVSTTFIAGTIAIREGISEPIGSLTQMGSLRLGKRNENREVNIKDLVPLTDLEDIVFGGWDIFEDNCYEAALKAGVIDVDLLNKIKPELSSIKPMKAVFDKKFVKKLDGQYVKSVKGHRERIEALRQDIRDFKKENDVSRLVMIWCGSTEVYQKPEGSVYDKLDSFEKALDSNDQSIAPSVLYAYAAMMEEVPYANGAPNLSVDFNAMYSLASEKKVPIAGKDFKTGQTLMKTILAPGFKARRIGIDGWFSTNILGTTQDTGGVHWTLPAMDIAGLGVQAYIGYSPTANDVAVAGGGVSGVSSTWSSGRDAGLTITHDSGLTLGAYVEEKSRQYTPTGGNDYFGGTWYVKYAMGPITIGWQESYLDAGAASSQANADAAKTVNTAAGLFEAEQYSIAFNINDNLSVSYAKAEDTYDAQGGATAGAVTGDAVADVAIDMKSIQAAYSMGSMSIKAYRTETDNVGYATNGGSLTVNEIALGLSF